MTPNIVTPPRIISVTSVVRSGSQLHGAVNSELWDQSLVRASIPGGFGMGRIARFRGNALVIPGA